jgi:hypothetical protein
MLFGVANYIIEFPNTLKFKTYDEGWSAGIIFYTDESTYEITYNRQANWMRILIKNNDRSWSDVPFNRGTWELLPKGVSVDVYS